MPVQTPQWMDVLCCCVCYNVFDAGHHQPVSLICCHTACRACLLKLKTKQCPFDQSAINISVADLPTNTRILKILEIATPELHVARIARLFVKEDARMYLEATDILETMCIYVKRAPSEKGGTIWSPQLSRPMQRKLINLLCCNLVEPEGRCRSMKAARSLGERCLTELLLLHQNPYHLSSNLWATVRARGCQFLGPAMQEEVLKLVLLALSEGALISRKVLVMYIVQTLEKEYPQASKTSVGHVVQLLYRASCFNVIKREAESSLMQLKEEFRTYDSLRREHDAQIVQIAMEAGLRISPDQWSALLYGDQAHKSHMQSIIDRLQSPQSFCQCIQELLINLQRTGDPGRLADLRMHFENLADVDTVHGDNLIPDWSTLLKALYSVRTVVEGQVKFCENYGACSRTQRESAERTVVAYKFKTSMCRDIGEGKSCMRGDVCTFAHSLEEMERFRARSRLMGYRSVGSTVNTEDANFPSSSSTTPVGRIGLPRLLMPSTPQSAALLSTPTRNTYGVEKSIVEDAMPGPGPGGTREAVDLWNAHLPTFDIQQGKAFLIQQPSIINGYPIQVASPTPLNLMHNHHQHHPPIESILQTPMAAVITHSTGAGLALSAFPLSLSSIPAGSSGSFTPLRYHLLRPSPVSPVTPATPVADSSQRPPLQPPSSHHVNAAAAVACTPPPTTAEFGVIWYPHPLATAPPAAHRPASFATGAHNDVVQFAPVLPLAQSTTLPTLNDYYSGVAAQLTPTVEAYYAFSPSGGIRLHYNDLAPVGTTLHSATLGAERPSASSDAIRSKCYTTFSHCTAVQQPHPLPTSNGHASVKEGALAAAGIDARDDVSDDDGCQCQDKQDDQLQLLGKKRDEILMRLSSIKRHRSSSLTEDLLLDESEEERKTKAFVHRVATSIFDDYGGEQQHGRLTATLSCGPQLIFHTTRATSCKCITSMAVTTTYVKAVSCGQHHDSAVQTSFSVPLSFKSTLRRSSSLCRSLSSEDDEKRRTSTTVSLHMQDTNDKTRTILVSSTSDTVSSSSFLVADNSSCIPSSSVPFWRHHSDADVTCISATKMQQRRQPSSSFDYSKQPWNRRFTEWGESAAAECWRSDDDQVIPFSGGAQVSRYGPISRSRTAAVVTADSSVCVVTSSSSSNGAETAVVQIRSAYARPLSTAVVQPLNDVPVASRKSVDPSSSVNSIPIVFQSTSVIMDSTTTTSQKSKSLNLSSNDAAVVLETLKVPDAAELATEEKMLLKELQNVNLDIEQLRK